MLSVLSSSGFVGGGGGGAPGNAAADGRHEEEEAGEAGRNKPEDVARIHLFIRGVVCFDVSGYVLRKTGVLGWVLEYG